MTVHHAPPPTLLTQTTLLSLASTVALLALAVALAQRLLPARRCAHAHKRLSYDGRTSLADRTHRARSPWSPPPLRYAGAAQRFTFVWLAFDALVHFTLEASFVFHSFPRPRTVNSGTGSSLPSSLLLASDEMRPSRSAQLVTPHRSLRRSLAGVCPRRHTMGHERPDRRVHRTHHGPRSWSFGSLLRQWDATTKERGVEALDVRANPPSQRLQRTVLIFLDFAASSCRAFNRASGDSSETRLTRA